MRERRYVKFKVDMYSDTKFKIIDIRPDRDLVHYVWNRVVVLGGKCNQEGDLYMSRTIPYTIETLAIEFNRGSEEVKLALEVLMELEMVELTEDRVYRVKNFVKHQNIKVKEKIKTKDKEGQIKNNDVQASEVSRNENSIKQAKKVDNNSQESIPIFSDVKNKKKGNKKKRVNNLLEFNFEENEDNQIDGIHDEERPLGKGESLIMEFSMFG